MATVDDVEVANASFPNVRQDLNDILEALATNFSADAEPTTTYPNQFWYETDSNLLYIRNEADDAWITLASINQTSGEWEPRTAVIQAVDSAGLALKTDEGTTRFSISDAGVVSFENYAFPSADGTNGQVLTTDGSGTLTFEDSGAGDKIEEGNSSVEVVDTGTGRIEFTTDGSEVMRIDGSGNVGIGTNSPAAKLDVRTTSFTPSSNAAALLIEDKSTWTQGAQFYLNNAGVYASGRPSGALGAVNSFFMYLSGGAISSGNPSAGSGFTASTTAASIYRCGDGTHTWYGNTGLTAGSAYTQTERMRIDSSGDLLFNSGYGSVATAYGCRAWVNFNGTGTVAIRDDGNVSSITDNGTGLYTVNLTTAMPDTNYAAIAGPDDTAGRMNLVATPTSSSQVALIAKGTDDLGYRDLINAQLAVFR